MEVNGTESVFPVLDVRAFTHDELCLAAQLTAPGDHSSVTWPAPPPANPALGFALSESSLKQTCALASDTRGVEAPALPKNLKREAERGAMGGALADPLAMLADASLCIPTDDVGELRRKTGSATDLLGESLLLLSQQGAIPPPEKKPKTSDGSPSAPPFSQEERLIASLHNVLAKDHHQQDHESKSDSAVGFRRPRGKPKVLALKKGTPAPDMPDGWLLEVRNRGSGNRVDKVWTSPEGVQLRSIKECEGYLLGKARCAAVQPVTKGKFSCPSCCLRFATVLDLGNHVGIGHAHPSNAPPQKVKSEEISFGGSDNRGLVLRHAKSEETGGMESCLSIRTARGRQRAGMGKGTDGGGASSPDLGECMDMEDKDRQLAQRNFHALLHNPPSWYNLELLTTNEAVAVQRLVAAYGRTRARTTLLQQRARISADIVNELYRPILSLLLFVLEGTDDISDAKLGVLALKRRVCRALGLKRRGADPLSPDTPSPPESPPLGATSEDDVMRRTKADVSRLPALAECERPRRVHREAALALPAPEWGGPDEEEMHPPRESCMAGGFRSGPGRVDGFHTDSGRSGRRDVNGASSRQVSERSGDEKASGSGQDSRCRMDVVESPAPRVTRKRTRVDTIWPDALTSQLMSAHAQAPVPMEVQIAGLDAGGQSENGDRSGNPYQCSEKHIRGGGVDPACQSVRSQPPGKLRWLGSRGKVPSDASEPWSSVRRQCHVPGGSVPNHEEPHGENVSEPKAEELRARAKAERDAAEELRQLLEQKLHLAESLEAQAAALEATCSLPDLDSDFGQMLPDTGKAGSDAGLVGVHAEKGDSDAALVDSDGRLAGTGEPGNGRDQSAPGDSVVLDAGRSVVDDVDMRSENPCDVSNRQSQAPLPAEHQWTAARTVLDGMEAADITRVPSHANFTLEGEAVGTGAFKKCSSAGLLGCEEAGHKKGQLEESHFSCGLGFENGLPGVAGAYQAPAWRDQGDTKVHGASKPGADTAAWLFVRGR